MLVRSISSFFYNAFYLIGRLQMVLIWTGLKFCCLVKYNCVTQLCDLSMVIEQCILLITIERLTHSHTMTPFDASGKRAF